MYGKAVKLLPRGTQMLLVRLSTTEQVKVIFSLADGLLQTQGLEEESRSQGRVLRVVAAIVQGTDVIIIETHRCGGPDSVHFQEEEL